MSINFELLKPLTSLEYAGMESVFQRIVSAYEDYQSIPLESHTPTDQITRRMCRGIEIHDGEYNLYLIEDFAVRTIFTVEGLCVMSGFRTDGRDLSECQGSGSDTIIDITEFLDCSYIDIDRLVEKITSAR